MARASRAAARGDSGQYVEVRDGAADHRTEPRRSPSSGDRAGHSHRPAPDFEADIGPLGNSARPWCRTAGRCRARAIAGCRQVFRSRYPPLRGSRVRRCARRLWRGDDRGSTKSPGAGVVQSRVAADTRYRQGCRCGRAGVVIRHACVSEDGRVVRARSCARSPPRVRRRRSGLPRPRDSGPSRLDVASGTGRVPRSARSFRGCCASLSESDVARRRSRPSSVGAVSSLQSVATE